MNRIVVVLLWHMHQPEYRDPATGDYLFPWTRLHALKDYVGMVKLLEEFPRVHVTFNLTPVLLRQVEHYATGNFRERLFDLTFKPAAELTREERLELLQHLFLGGERLMLRLPRLRELYLRRRGAGGQPERLLPQFGHSDWLDLQVLSQLAWLDEFYLARDPLIRVLVAKGRDYSEEDKQRLRAKEIELIGMVIPTYRAAAARGQVELSTSPFYHPILPLLIDTEVARQANPQGRLPATRFAYLEDAREQLSRALELHARLFGLAARGLWPSEGSVSAAVAELAAESGLRWLATDEGVLGRSLDFYFARDAQGNLAAPEVLYRPYTFQTARGPVHFIFRDHYLSNLVGFIYHKMDSAQAAADFHRRLRQLAQPVLASGRDALIPVILDGENAWEYYPENGRPFLRHLYQAFTDDPQIEALTVSEALSQWRDPAPLTRLVPGSWINANFDVWIGHPEDHRAWELLAAARAFYAQRAASGQATAEELRQAYEALLVAEGSDWCWWFGPEHASSEDADFDFLYRQYLTQVYHTLGAEPPYELTLPIKRPPVRVAIFAPTGYIFPTIDGNVTDYFEWLGAGIYVAERRGAAMHGQRFFFKEIHYGFDLDHLYLRVDFLPGVLREVSVFEIRVRLQAAQELQLQLEVERGELGKLTTYLDAAPAAPPPTSELALMVAVKNILELRIPRKLVPMNGGRRLQLSISFWEAGLPLDVLPAEGWLEIEMGEESFAWRGV